MIMPQSPERTLFLFGVPILYSCDIACISTEQRSSGCIPLYLLYSHTTRRSSMLLQTSRTDSGAICRALPPVAVDDDCDDELELTFDDSATDHFVVDEVVDRQIRLRDPPPLECTRYGPQLYNFYPVLITATSSFLSRLVGSPLQATFASYVTTTSSVFNVLALAHATATSKRVGI
ncbi:hypothetical protein DFJ58DRAFT_916016 [Suillus subalutaceus]|uniref:uncharacterized protein n=1 Tax=Suillus subalutaceus TaxID=48586 RepID=UPI001B8768FD|nr:uncharacterized protein DFJ58DRAFT_916016 [Suillus subalutaceus]KAG1843106.1 hypothetical protein DFJ58DRAFT_916016 [Suillus subalutaceus]